MSLKSVREIAVAVITSFFILIAILFTIAVFTKPEPPTRADVVKNAFGSDGQHMHLERIIKHDLNDPESYRHVKTVYFDRETDTLQVFMAYRSKNVFGGYETHEVVALTSVSSGKVYEIILND